MKKLLFLPLLMVTSLCLAQNAQAIIGKPIKIGNLLVAQNDFPNRMNWDEAILECSKLGSGWRLPTISELELLSKNYRKDYNNLEIGYYWSSTKAKNGKICFFNFVNDKVYFGPKTNTAYVRAFYVKLEQKQEYTYIIGAPIKIGNLLVAQFDLPNKMNWYEAKVACAKIGKGWRIPENYELQFILGNNADKLQNLREGFYWGTLKPNDPDYKIDSDWALNFKDHEFGSFNKKEVFNIRIVKSYK